MAELNELILEQLLWIIGGMALLTVILLIVSIAQGAKLRKFKRKYEAMMAGSGVEDLESLLINLKIQMDSIEDEHKLQTNQLQVVMQKLTRIQGKIGVKRYNAYGEHGSDLSFSMAMINDSQDGMILTGIYNRDGSYVYAKPLKGGESTYTLSPEEKEAITLAQQAE
ncbi:DUF4446 family protein [Paenibacillus amylolyticus]|nr:DUF4446 family protein [Paenibacillus amylolyticus]WFR63712.1 DUF4446 family protein [Paenibacillus amylolyticus]